MRIVNQANGKIIAEKVIFADTFLKRLKGLLTAKEMEWDEALIIKPCNSVHSIGMRFSIDLLFLSDSNEVIKVIEGFAPWRASPIILRAASVIELPAGKVVEACINTGDKITIQIGNNDPT